MNKVLKVLGVVAVCIIVFCLFAVFLWRTYGPNDSAAITKEAISQKNVELCNTIRSPFIGIGGGTADLPVAICYEGYAEAYPRQQICSEFLASEKTGNTLYDNSIIYTDYARCVDGEATSQSDPKICLQIDQSGYRSLCVAGIANEYMDRTMCNVLPLEADQKECLANIIFH